MRGKLFIFEGPDGVGKTTLSNRLMKALNAAGMPCERFTFPGQEPGTLGKHVYDLHHEPMRHDVHSLSPASLQLLHIAAHIDTINSRILPALRAGHHVVLDRFWWSTWVYGLITGVSRHSLRAMIGIESDHWGKVLPAAVFLLSRKSGVNGNSSLLAYLAEYKKLADIEKAKYPVYHIENDRTIENTLAHIFQKPVLSVYHKKKSILPDDSAAPSQRELRFHSTNNYSSPPAVFSKLSPVKPTIVYDTYWRFAAERQAMFFRRARGEPAPWTQDPILREYKFTNAYRASDRASQYLIRNIIYSGDQAPDELFFRILLFKLFNRIETWELLVRAFGQISYDNYSFHKYDAELTRAIDSGVAIYSGAYIMPSGGRSSNGRKHQMHLRLIDQMIKEDLPSRLAEAKSMSLAFDLLRGYPTIGDFLAYQYLIDLNYSPLLNFNENDFVMPGPGARDGIKKCFSDRVGLTEADIIKLVTDRQDAEFERLELMFQPLWGRPLQLIDCQNLFCEVDKYARLKHPEFCGHTGRTRIKQRYRYSAKPLNYWYPPKWHLNERIARGSLYVQNI